MMPAEIPTNLAIPTTAMGMKALALEYNRAPSTLRRRFAKLRINEIIIDRMGRNFTPEQLLIIFYLHGAPPKFYLGYVWLEQHGYIDILLKKYHYAEFLERRNNEKKNGKRATNGNLK